MLQSILDEAAIDARGGSNTDTEEECDFGLVVYHLLHRDDMTDEKSEENGDEESTNESQHAEDEEDTTCPADEEKPSNNDEQKRLVTLQQEQDEQRHNDRQEFDQRILFELQNDFVFEWVSTTKMYIARPRTDLAHKMAIKIVKDKQCRKQNYFPMELRVLSHIRSNSTIAKNLQQLQGFFTRPSGYAFFSPFAENLCDLCKYRNFAKSPREIKSIMHELLLAIASLHKMDVMHRDVKQSNILWQDGKLTLIDYDLATWNQQGRKHFSVQGTLGFIAPEILQFERDTTGSPKFYNNKIDIYSAGVVFGCLLLGVPENDVTEIYVRAFREHAHIFLPNDPCAVDMLEMMIDLDPDSRPTAPTLLKHKYFSSLS